jgi:hypothetical protein
MSCERCGSPSRPRRYCAGCKQTIDELKRKYAESAARILAKSGPLGSEWADLERWRDTAALPIEEARKAIADLIRDWLRRYETFAASGGQVTLEQIDTFRRAAAVLGAPPSLVQPLESQLNRAYWFGCVRNGQLPIVQVPELHLPSDERCYLSLPATRWRPLKSGPQPVQGS